jgi:hypothetical protein
VLAAQTLLDLPNQCFRIAADPSEDFAGVVPPAVGDQKAGRLGDDQHADQECDRRYGLHPEHPAPSRRAQPEGRAGAAGDSEATPSEVAATRALELPLASALVVALLATRWIYPQAPRVVTNIVGLLILLPAVLIVRRLASPTLVPAVYAVGGFILIDRIREACWSMPLLEQWLFLLEMVFGIGLLALAFSSARIRGDDGDPATAWGGSLRGLLAGLIIAVACAVVVGALGFMRLARLLGDGVLISSYVALALYAALRVAQGLVASVLRARPIRQLLMVQRYRDLLQHRLDRVLCGIAVGA